MREFRVVSSKVPARFVKFLRVGQVISEDNLKAAGNDVESLLSAGSIVDLSQPVVTDVEQEALHVEPAPVESEAAGNDVEADSADGLAESKAPTPKKPKARK